MITNKVKTKLRAGENVHGIFINVASPDLVEIAGVVGFDFVIIDAEHSSAGVETVEHMVRAAECRGVGTVTRIALNAPQNILRYIDTGSQGVQIPLIDTAEAARSIVAAVKYPPMGKRGIAHVRPSDYATPSSALGAYAEQANRETLISVQIETMEGVENLDRIMEVEQLDVIFIGPADLANAMGYASQTTHPDVLRKIGELGERIRKAGKIAGTTAHTPEAHKRWRDAGFQYLATVFTLQYIPAIKGFVEACR